MYSIGLLDQVYSFFLLNHERDNQSWLFACLKSLFVAAKKNDFITSVHQTFREHKAKRRVT